MKKHTMLFMLCFISPVINAGKIWIKNTYKDPIVINLDGNDIRELKTGDSDFLPWDPQSIKIRAQNSSIYYSNAIQERYNEIKKSVLPNPNLKGTIIVLNTNNPFSFPCDTKIEQYTQTPAEQQAQRAQSRAQEKQQIEQRFQQQKDVDAFLKVMQHGGFFDATTRNRLVYIELAQYIRPRNWSPFQQLKKELFDLANDDAVKNNNIEKTIEQNYEQVCSAVLNDHMKIGSDARDKKNVIQELIKYVSDKNLMQNMRAFVNQ
jgi:hypothetical protein